VQWAAMAVKPTISGEVEKEKVFFVRFAQFESRENSPEK
jgi:hypothetical protein